MIRILFRECGGTRLKTGIKGETSGMYAKDPPLED